MSGTDATPPNKDTHPQGIAEQTAKLYETYMQAPIFPPLLAALVYFTNSEADRRAMAELKWVLAGFYSEDALSREEIIDSIEHRIAALIQLGGTEIHE